MTSPNLQGINNHVLYFTSIYLIRSFPKKLLFNSKPQKFCWEANAQKIYFLVKIHYLILFTIKPRMNREICIKIQRDEYVFNNGLLFFSSLGVFDFSQWIFVFCYLIISASSFRVDKKSWKHKSVNLTQ